MAKQELNVGIVGGGIGGVMAAIAIAKAGGNVTVLEAAEQLGEIGAGIQMVSHRRSLKTFADIQISIDTKCVPPAYTIWH